VNHLIKCTFYKKNTPLERPNQEIIRIFVTNSFKLYDDDDDNEDC